MPLGTFQPEAFSKLADLGGDILRRLHDGATSPHSQKVLRTLGPKEMADLVGYSAVHIARLEKEGRLPKPKTAAVGTVERRVYTLEDVARIRKILGVPTGRPPGASPLVVGCAVLKGGVGKSTISIHLAQYLAYHGYRVLLIDLDPQASATSVFGYVPDLQLDISDTIFSALIDDPGDINPVIRRTYWHGLDLIPSQLNLQNAEYLLATGKDGSQDGLDHRIYRLRQALGAIESDYDVIVLDTPPSLGLLNFNAVFAADYLVTPFVPQMYDLASSVQYFRVLEQVLSYGEPRLRAMNILISRMNAGKEAARLHQVFVQCYGDYVLPQVLKETQEVQKASSDIISIYETTSPRGSRETYRNALNQFNAVNEALLKQMQELWDEEVQAGTEPLEAQA